MLLERGKCIHSRQVPSFACSARQCHSARKVSDDPRIVRGPDLSPELRRHSPVLVGRRFCQPNPSRMPSAWLKRNSQRTSGYTCAAGGSCGATGSFLVKISIKKGANISSSAAMQPWLERVRVCTTLFALTACLAEVS